MTLLRMQKARRGVRLACGSLAMAVLIATASARCLHAQSPDHPLPPQPGQIHTFFLKNISDLNEILDIQTAHRNMLPNSKIYAESTENAITIRSTQEDLDAAQKLIAELDRPKQAYRVTYTISEMDNGKRISSHSVSVVVPANGKGIVKQGKRVPIVTGSSGTGSDVTTQVQYVDVGMNLEANAMGPQLRTKIEQSAVGEEKPVVGAQDPVIDQTMFEGTSPLEATRPVVLGTIDVPGSTHQQQISVTSELLSGYQQ